MTLIDNIRDKAGEINFSGMVLVRDGQNPLYREAFGYADRSNRIPNREKTRFAIASGTKTFTAAGIFRLIDRGKLTLDTPLHSVVKEDFPLIDKAVTIDSLLSHRSGIYDYLDEELIDDYDGFELAVPNHKLYGPRDYIPMLHGDMKFPPGERFSYSNSGYILLALVIETLSGQSFSGFIEEEVFKPAGMNHSGFFEMNRLPGDTAYGYIDDNKDWKTNIFDVPVKGCGDGGAFTTAEDLSLFWFGLMKGSLLSEHSLACMTEKVSSVKPETGYGRGLWIGFDREKYLYMEGCDAGVSCLSVYYSDARYFTVLSNTTTGAYPLRTLIHEQLKSRPASKKRDYRKSSSKSMNGTGI
ncbi:serine hydrolase domain-containing protein [Spirochaeta isovalerica]|uniref:CubicO group peptidase (Beta-lactamase class C family) n=1 Tax=Spirochaeta isovalerica TaxID=150 RepID=A0A841R982_9SPIO|nr:serine hydrolase domain-containing protein [Spirochaeta isovalerica]MBB6480346.1 CubicO group peptidase (beta-lactamase class C family) [Spirochaeta isovalerica]